MYADPVLGPRAMTVLGVYVGQSTQFQYTQTESPHGKKTAGQSTGYYVTGFRPIASAEIATS